MFAVVFGYEKNSISIFGSTPLRQSWHESNSEEIIWKSEVKEL